MTLVLSANTEDIVSTDYSYILPVVEHVDEGILAALAQGRLGEGSHDAGVGVDRSGTEGCQFH